MLFEFRSDRKIVDIPIVKIRPCRFGLREDYPVDMIRELAESIEKNGMLHPVLVRKVSREEYELIAGERRLRAASYTGMKKIPCIVKKISDKQAGIDALEENLRRNDINSFEEAELLCKLKNEYGIELSDENYNTLRMLSFDENERDIMNRYGFTDEHAKALLRINDHVTRRYVISEIIEEGMNVSQTNKYIEKLLLSEKAERLSRQKNKFIIKNIGIFENTINKAVSVMRKTGLNVSSEKREGYDHFEFTIRVTKAFCRMERKSDSA